MAVLGLALGEFGFQQECIRAGNAFLARQPVEDLDVPARAPARCGRGETILLVEDEPSVALLAERVLQQAGYTVVTAGNGQRALEQVLALELEFDLLLTDVIMPAMGGPELAERLRAIRPDLKVLFCSGYTDDALTQRGVLQGGVDLLRKPYGVEELKRRVREALDAG